MAVGIKKGNLLVHMCGTSICPSRPFWADVADECSAYVYCVLPWGVCSVGTYNTPLSTDSGRRDPVSASKTPLLECSWQIHIKCTKKLSLKSEAYTQKLFRITSSRRGMEVLKNENSLYSMLEWGKFWVMQDALQWRSMLQAECDWYNINCHQFWHNLEVRQLRFWWNTGFWWCSYAI